MRANQGAPCAAMGRAMKYINRRGPREPSSKFKAPSRLTGYTAVRRLARQEQEGRAGAGSVMPQ